jgi:transcriptional antiterminator RfaH
MLGHEVREPIGAAPRREGEVARASGADACGSEGAWYVVYSKPHGESTAQRHLTRKGIDVFYPQLVLPDYAGRAVRCMPLFPNYLFVRIHLARQFQDVVWSPGVKRFVGSDGVPAAIDDDVVAYLRRTATPDGHLRARSDLEAGEEIEVVAGPFAGLVGIIQRPPDAKGRIRVLMRLLNRQSVNVEIPIRFVKTGWVA